MKILALSYLFPPTIKGGAEISTYHTLKGLLEYGCEINLITGRNTRTINSEFDVLSSTSFHFPRRIHFISEFFTPQKVAKEILSRMEMNKFDVIHAHDIYSLLVIAELKKQLLNFEYNRLPKFVFTVRDYLSVCSFGNLLTTDKNSLCMGCQINRLSNCLSYKTKSFIYKPFGLILPKLAKTRKMSLAMMDGLIYISHSIKNEIEKRVQYKYTTKVIYNPLSEKWLKKTLKKKDRNTILYVGSLEMHKGVEFFLDVLKEALPLFPDLKVYIAGEGREKDKYIRVIKKFKMDEQIYFLGQIPQEKLKLLYERSSILIAPSLWPEPFGRVAIEGMVNKCIVLVSDCGAFPEIVTDGVNGFLFPSNDKDALLKKLKFVIENQDQLESIRENAFISSHRFERDKIAKKYLDFYKELNGND